MPAQDARRHHHLDVEQGALFQPLRLQHAAGGVELVEPDRPARA